MDDIKPIFRSARDRLADYFVKQVRDHDLVDVKFFPCTDPSVTAEDAAEAMLAMLLSPMLSGREPFDAEVF